MRKRTRLDTIEANFIYAKVLLEFNRIKGFSELPIPVRNSLIDSACEEIIERANDSKDIEALKAEINSYKLTDEEKIDFYKPEFYEPNVEKPKNFNESLKEKYSNFISEITAEKFHSFDKSIHD